MDVGYGADITDMSAISTSISGLPAYSTNYIAVVACNGTSCSDYQGNTVVKSASTTPPVAPFSGIKTISQPASVEGLTTAIITWDLPNTNFGVYDDIKLFKSSRTGVFNTTTDLIGVYDLMNPTVIGYDMGSYSATSRTIKGLVTDTEYCFVAKAYSGTRTHTNQTVTCITPSYQSPVFVGANNTCDDLASSGFTVTWPTPNPLGVFSSYEIYIKSGTSGFSFDDAIAGNVAYKKYLASSTSNEITVSDLVPASTYQIGIRTYFKHPLTNDEYRDSNQKIVSCSTVATKAINQGWNEVIAVGAKIDGLTGLPILERMKPRSDVDYQYPIFQEIDDPARHTSRGYNGVAGITASNQGIVYLSWNDFELSGLGEHIFDYKDDAGTGYNIYRLNWKSDYNTSPPTINEAGWTKLNSSLIKPIRTVNANTNEIEDFAEYIDYTVTQNTSTDTAKIYYYKVEAVLNSSPLALSSEVGEVFSDSIIKIVLPPRNMALVHRWIANLASCSMVGRSSDRNNHYRCNFNGVGSSGGYYDVGGHLLVDRFKMGCNFTRGNVADPTKKCVAAAATTAFEGAATDTNKGIIEGDCIGSGYTPNDAAPRVIAGVNSAKPTTGLVNSKEGSVFLTRFYANPGACFINTTGGIGSGLTGSTWGNVSAIESNATTLAASTLPLNSAETPMGTGYAAKFSTNNANMPRLSFLSQEMGQKICMGHKVTLNSKDYQKKMLRKAESHLIRDFNHLVHDTNIEDKVMSDTLSSTLPDGDCGLTANRGIGIDVLDFYNPQWATVNLSGQSMFLNGSQGDNSTEKCISRFGIQDVEGNGYEWLSDQVWCNGTTCSYGYKDVANTDPFNSTLDLGAKEKMRNGSGEYMSWAATNSIGVDPAVTGDVTAHALSIYFNPMVGFPMTCSGTACASASDDNVLVSLKNEATTNNVYTDFFSFNLNLDYLNNKNTNVAGTIYKFFTAGTSSAGGFSGRWRFYFYNTLVDSTTTRCSVRLSETNGVID